MTAPFAALEARLNRAVFSRLSNADAVLAGVAVSGIFDAAYELGSVGLSGMASSQPSFTLATELISSSVVGSLLSVRNINYTVVAHQPDGSGVSILFLECVS